MRGERAGAVTLFTGRLGARLGALPRALAHDLWTTAGDPLPRPKRSGWHDWLPVLVVGLVLCAALLAAVGINTLIWQYGLNPWYACLLGGTQAASLVAALYRPVPAWWAATAVMIAVALSSDGTLVHDALPPWTAAGLAAQAGVLLLMALRLRPRVAVEALAISLLAGIAPGTAGAGPHLVDPRIPLAVLSTAVVVGVALRGRQVARSELVAQEERTAEERGRRTLLEERNRIARELHDVVAHHMSVISIQAQVAPLLVENPSAELRENLAGIRQNAVEALTELRRVLGVLRSEDVPSSEARHAPQPTLDRLPDLLTNVRAAGLTVTTEVTGTRHDLPPGVDLSAFRIVQESLSNAMRHAPGAPVRVRIGYRPAALTVRVTNTAPATPPPAATGVGHGLLGMRERVAMLAGDFTDGPTPEGGYEVMAMLPLEAPESPENPA